MALRGSPLARPLSHTRVLLLVPAGLLLVAASLFLDLHTNSHRGEQVAAAAAGSIGIRQPAQTSACEPAPPSRREWEAPYKDRTGAALVPLC